MAKNLVNSNKPDKWKKDVIQSVDYYNQWFLDFAPSTFRQARIRSIENVEKMLIATDFFRNSSPCILRNQPEILSILRMSTAPPLSRDRLIGLSNVSASFVKRLESGKLPSNFDDKNLNEGLEKVYNIIMRLLDVDIFNWLESNQKPSEVEWRRAASIIADRVCGAIADPIIRNEQEKRQLDKICNYLTNLGYKYVSPTEIINFKDLVPGTFTFHLNVPVFLSEEKRVNIPVDVVIQRFNSKKNQSLPLLVECKSAGDFTNTNKRRKEEAVKVAQIKTNYEKNVEFILFLCGYFDSGYLGYEAAEGMDWVWEHRIEDLSLFRI